MKKFFAMLTVCALMLSLCGLPSVGAAENVPDENSIFFTDFDGYRVGNGNWVSEAYGKNIYASGWIEPNVEDSSKGAKADEEHGTSLFFDTWLCDGWPQTYLNFTPALNDGKVLISYDFLMNTSGWWGAFALGSSGNIQFKDNEGETIVSHGSSQYKNAFKVGKWAKIEVYIDFTSKEYALYIDGNEIFAENNSGVSEGGISQISFQRYGAGDIYMDNLEVKKVFAPPYLPELNAALPTGVAVGKTLDVTFSSGVNQETLDNIKITDSKGAPIAFTIAEKTANGVKLRFTEPLTAGECYSVDMSGVEGLLGQDVVCGNNKTEAYAGNNNLMFTNFDGYAFGEDGAWTNLAFGAKGEDGSQKYMVDEQFMFILNGAMEPKQMENHGTSAFMGADVEYNYMALGYWRDGGFAFNQGQKYLISYDLLMGDADALHIFATEGTKIAVLFSGTGVSERNEFAPLKENVLELGKWARVELYMDPGNKKYSVYVDGKLIGEEQSFEFNNPAAPEVGIINFRNVTQSNGIYIDNVGIASLDEMPIAKNEITLKEGENNTVIADYKATAEKAGVFIAAYDEGGILLNAAYKTNQSVDGKGYEGTLSMNKVDGAKTYKAFLWNDSYQPLCPASNPLTVQ